MALVNSDNDPGDVDQLEAQIREEITRPVEKQEDDPAPRTEDDVPEKYRGKSVKDIIEMHRNAESRLGELGNEVGRYKSLTDELLDLKRSEDLQKGGAGRQEMTLKEISSTDLFDKPSEAIASVVEATLARREEQQRKQQEEAALAAREFQSRHPDLQDIVNSSEFREWVTSSPVRQRVAAQAAQNDFDAAEALLNDYKAIREQKPQKKKETTIDPYKEARRASTESVGSSPDSAAPSGKVYRRIDLIKLKLEKPDVYADPGFQQEIMRAYAEGRVR